MPVPNLNKLAERIVQHHLRKQGTFKVQKQFWPALILACMSDIRNTAAPKRVENDGDVLIPVPMPLWPTSIENYTSALATRICEGFVGIDSDTIMNAEAITLDISSEGTYTDGFGKLHFSFMEVVAVFAFRIWSKQKVTENE